jgi:16S rRNA (uracil1498-N3)-methyltransferase
MTRRVLAQAGTLQDGATIELEDAELHHLRVRRIGVDDEVIVLDGAGSSAHGSIRKLGSGCAVAIGAVHRAPAPATTVLAVGAGDKDRFLLLAERCTELGMARLVPIDTERSRAVDSRVRGGVLERARRRAREACKQSGSPWATVVEDSCELADLSIRHPNVRWLLAEHAAGRCPRVAADAAVGWIIGPEGGFTSGEMEYCRVALAAESVGFGPAILRFDTAAMAAGVITQDRRRAG